MCNGVSKTVNVPFETSVSAIATIYEEAARLKCKGITIYRDGCRDDQPINI